MLKRQLQRRMLGNGDEEHMVDSDGFIERNVIGNEANGHIDNKLKKLANTDATVVLDNLRTLISIGYDMARQLRCIICVCLVGVGVLLLLMYVEMNK